MPRYIDGTGIPCIDDLPEIAVQFIQSCASAVSAWEAWNAAYGEAGIRHCSITAVYVFIAGRP